MPNQPESTGLHLALSMGAEQGLVRAIAESDSPARVAQFVQARLSNLDPADLQFIIDLAHSMIAAGQYIESLLPDEEPDLTRIPVNGDLFAEDQSGKRTWWGGLWNIPGTDEWFRFSGTLPDVPTNAEIQRAAQELAFSYIQGSGERFPGAGSIEAPSDINVRIIGTERSF